MTFGSLNIHLNVIFNAHPCNLYKHVNVVCPSCFLCLSCSEKAETASDCSAPESEYGLSVFEFSLSISGKYC